MPSVILTNEHGNPQGLLEVMEAHTGQGKLHKAFSVFVFRNKGKEILLQQRSTKKMLFPLIWANTCCGHPRDGEQITEAGERRLQEECGFSCPLKEVTSFVYRAEDPGGHGVEYEHDTILVGNVKGDTEINPDPEEIAAVEWISLKKLQVDMEANPKKYAPWLHKALKILLEHEHGEK